LEALKSGDKGSNRFIMTQAKGDPETANVAKIMARVAIRGFSFVVGGTSDFQH